MTITSSGNCSFVKRVNNCDDTRSRHLDRGQEYPPLEDFLFTENGNINIGYQPLQRSIYHYHLVRWMRYFPLSQIHIVDGDKFIKEPWTELMALEKFLDLPAEITERNFFFNSTKGFYCGKEELTLPQSKWTCTRDKCLSKSKVVLCIDHVSIIITKTFVIAGKTQSQGGGEHLQHFEDILCETQRNILRSCEKEFRMDI